MAKETTEKKIHHSKENKRKVTKSKNKTQNRTQNKTENNQNMKKTEHNELLSFLRVFRPQGVYGDRKISTVHPV